MKLVMKLVNGNEAVDEVGDEAVDEADIPPDKSIIVSESSVSPTVARVIR